MVKITYVESNGTKHTVDVDEGLSIMEGAVTNSIPGIDADCGGGCACATCMVFIDIEWKEKINSMSEEEESMIDFHEHKNDDSRLSCQISVTAAVSYTHLTLPTILRV